MNRWWGLLGRETQYVLGLYLLLLGLLSLLRLAFLGAHAPALRGIAPATLGQGLLLGLRFDLAVASYLLLPLFLALLWPRGTKPAWLDPLLSLLVCGLVVAGLIVLIDGQPLGATLQQRIYPSSALPPGTCPPQLALLLGAGLWLLFRFGQRRLGRRIFPSQPGQAPAQERLLRTMGATLLLALMLVAAHGGPGHQPLAWADAQFSAQDFANLLPPNGVCCLGHALHFPAAPRP